MWAGKLWPLLVHWEYLRLTRRSSSEGVLAGLGWFLRVVLALVFVASSATKATVGGRQRFYRALAPLLKVTRVRHQRLVLVAVIVSELAVVAGLSSGIPSIQFWLVAVCLLLSSFTVILAAAVARGEIVACACFGSLSTRPAGSSTIFRNCILACLAIAAIAIEARQSVAWLAVSLLAIGLLTAQTIALVEMSRRVSTRARLRPLASEGTDPPAIGVPVNWAAESHGGSASADVLLAFLSASCGSCLRAPEEVARIVSDRDAEPYAVVDEIGATQAEAMEMRTRLAENHLPSVPTNQGYDLIQRLNVKTYPSFALVSSGTVVTSCVGSGNLESLFSQRSKSTE